MSYESLVLDTAAPLRGLTRFIGAESAPRDWLDWAEDVMDRRSPRPTIDGPDLAEAVRDGDLALTRLAEREASG